MIIKEFFEGPVGDYCIARKTIKCLFNCALFLELNNIFGLSSPEHKVLL